MSVPIESGIEAYLQHVIVEKGLSVNTVGAYRRDLERFVEWLAQAGVEDLTTVTTAQLGTSSHGLPGTGG